MSIADVHLESKAVCARSMPGDRLALHSTGVPEELSLMRLRVADFAREMPFDDGQIQDIMLAVGEALTNALKYGRRNSCSTIRLTAARRGDALCIAVADEGCGFDPARVQPMGDLDEFSENGRGIALMRAVMDSVEFEAKPTGMRVEMIKRLP